MKKIDPYVSIAVCSGLLGLFPVFFLPVLQISLAVMLLSVLIEIRRIPRETFTNLLTFPNIAFAQFTLYFFFNALLYPVSEGNLPHYRSIALESWSVTFLALGIVALWLNLHSKHQIQRALMFWLPLGLTISFCVASAIYFSDRQGIRIWAFTPNPQIPPMWFLIFTLCSFCWFAQLPRWQKFWRIALYVMAGLMVIYSSARLVMIAWMICGIALSLWILRQPGQQMSWRQVFYASVLCVLSVIAIFVVDSFSGGIMITRFGYQITGLNSYAELMEYYPRLEIWTSALSIIRENLFLGIGQVNERMAMDERLGWDLWYQAHQTYLSYMIAGGFLALISGLIMQSPAFVFLQRENRVSLTPAFLGLGVVITLNCLTNSVLQSAVSVQAFMMCSMFFLKMRD